MKFETAFSFQLPPYIQGLMDSCRERVQELLRLIQDADPVLAKSPEIVEVITFIKRRAVEVTSSQQETQVRNLSSEIKTSTASLLDPSGDKLSYADIAAGRVSPCPFSDVSEEPTQLLFIKQFTEKLSMEDDKESNEFKVVDINVSEPVLNVQEIIEPIQQAKVVETLTVENNPRRGRSPRRRAAQKETVQKSDVPKIYKERHDKDSKEKLDKDFDLRDENKTVKYEEINVAKQLLAPDIRRGRSPSPMWVPGESASYAAILRGGSLSRPESRSATPDRNIKLHEQTILQVKQTNKPPSKTREILQVRDGHWKSETQVDIPEPVTDHTTIVSETQFQGLPQQSNVQYTNTYTEVNVTSNLHYPPGLFQSYICPEGEVASFIASGQQLISSGLGTYTTCQSYTGIPDQTLYSEETFNVESSALPSGNSFDKQQAVDFKEKSLYSEEKPTTYVHKPVAICVKQDSQTYSNKFEEISHSSYAHSENEPPAHVVDNEPNVSYARILAQGLSTKPLRLQSNESHSPIRTETREWSVSPSRDALKVTGKVETTVIKPECTSDQISAMKVENEVKYLTDAVEHISEVQDKKKKKHKNKSSQQISEITVTEGVPIKKVKTETERTVQLESDPNILKEKSTSKKSKKLKSDIGGENILDVNVKKDKSESKEGNVQKKKSKDRKVSDKKDVTENIVVASESSGQLNAASKKKKGGKNQSTKKEVELIVTNKLLTEVNIDDSKDKSIIHLENTASSDINQVKITAEQQENVEAEVEISKENSQASKKLKKKVIKGSDMPSVTSNGRGKKSTTKIDYSQISADEEDKNRKTGIDEVVTVVDIETKETKSKKKSKKGKSGAASSLVGIEITSVKEPTAVKNKGKKSKNVVESIAVESISNVGDLIPVEQDIISTGANVSKLESNTNSKKKASKKTVGDKENVDVKSEVHVDGNAINAETKPEAKKKKGKKGKVESSESKDNPNDTVKSEMVEVKVKKETELEGVQPKVSSKKTKKIKKSPEENLITFTMPDILEDVNNSEVVLMNLPSQLTVETLQIIDVTEQEDKSESNIVSKKKNKKGKTVAESKENVEFIKNEFDNNLITNKVENEKPELKQTGSKKKGNKSKKITDKSVENISSQNSDKPDLPETSAKMNVEIKEIKVDNEIKFDETEDSVEVKPNIESVSMFEVKNTLLDQPEAKISTQKKKGKKDKEAKNMDKPKGDLPEDNKQNKVNKTTAAKNKEDKSEFNEQQNSLDGNLQNVTLSLNNLDSVANVSKKKGKKVKEIISLTEPDSKSDVKHKTLLERSEFLAKEQLASQLPDSITSIPVTNSVEINESIISVDKSMSDVQKMFTVETKPMESILLEECLTSTDKLDDVLVSKPFEAAKKRNKKGGKKQEVDIKTSALTLHKQVGALIETKSNEKKGKKGKSTKGEIAKDSDSSKSQSKDLISEDKTLTIDGKKTDTSSQINEFYIEGKSHTVTVEVPTESEDKSVLVQSFMDVLKDISVALNKPTEETDQEQMLPAEKEHITAAEKSMALENVQIEESVKSEVVLDASLPLQGKESEEIKISNKQKLKQPHKAFTPPAEKLADIETVQITKVPLSVYQESTDVSKSTVKDVDVQELLSTKPIEVIEIDIKENVVSEVPKHRTQPKKQNKKVQISENESSKSKSKESILEYFTENKPISQKEILDKKLSNAGDDLKLNNQEKFKETGTKTKDKKKNKQIKNKPTDNTKVTSIEKPKTELQDKSHKEHKTTKKQLVELQPLQKQETDLFVVGQKISEEIVDSERLEDLVQSILGQEDDFKSELDAQDIKTDSRKLVIEEIIIGGITPGQMVQDFIVNERINEQSNTNEAILPVVTKHEDKTKSVQLSKVPMSPDIVEIELKEDSEISKITDQIKSHLGKSSLFKFEETKDVAPTVVSQSIEKSDVLGVTLQSVNNTNVIVPELTSQPAQSMEVELQSQPVEVIGIKTKLSADSSVDIVPEDKIQSTEVKPDVPDVKPQIKVKSAKGKDSKVKPQSIDSSKVETLDIKLQSFDSSKVVIPDVKNQSAQTTKVEVSEVKSQPDKSTKVKPKSVESTKIETFEVKFQSADNSKVVIPEIKSQTSLTTKIEVTKVKSHPAKSTTVETNQIKLQSDVSSKDVISEAAEAKPKPDKTAKIKGSKVKPQFIESTKVEILDVKLQSFENSKVAVPEVKSQLVQTTKVEIPEVKSQPLESTTVQTPEIKLQSDYSIKDVMSEMTTVSSQSTKIEAPYIKPQSGKSKAKGSKVKPQPVESTKVEILDVKPQSFDSSKVVIPELKSQSAQSTKVEIPNVKLQLNTPEVPELKGQSEFVSESSGDNALSSVTTPDTHKDIDDMFGVKESKDDIKTKKTHKKGKKLSVTENVLIPESSISQEKPAKSETKQTPKPCDFKPKPDEKTTTKKNSKKKFKSGDIHKDSTEAVIKLDSPPIIAKEKSEEKQLFISSAEPSSLLAFTPPWLEKTIQTAPVVLVEEKNVPEIKTEPIVSNTNPEELVLTSQVAEEIGIFGSVRQRSKHATPIEKDNKSFKDDKVDVIQVSKQEKREQKKKDKKNQAIGKQGDSKVNKIGGKTPDKQSVIHDVKSSTLQFLESEQSLPKSSPSHHIDFNKVDLGLQLLPEGFKKTSDKKPTIQENVSVSSTKFDNISTGLDKTLQEPVKSDVPHEEKLQSLVEFLISEKTPDVSKNLSNEPSTDQIVSLNIVTPGVSALKEFESASNLKETNKDTSVFEINKLNFDKDSNLADKKGLDTPLEKPLNTITTIVGKKEIQKEKTVNKSDVEITPESNVKSLHKGCVISSLEIETQESKIETDKQKGKLIETKFAEVVLPSVSKNTEEIIDNELQESPKLVPGLNLDDIKQGKTVISISENKSNVKPVDTKKEVNHKKCKVKQASVQQPEIVSDIKEHENQASLKVQHSVTVVQSINSDSSSSVTTTNTHLEDTSSINQSFDKPCNVKPTNKKKGKQVDSMKVVDPIATAKIKTVQIQNSSLVSENEKQKANDANNKIIEQIKDAEEVADTKSSLRESEIVQSFVDVLEDINVALNKQEEVTMQDQNLSFISTEVERNANVSMKVQAKSSENVVKDLISVVDTKSVEATKPELNTSLTTLKEENNIPSVDKSDIPENVEVNKSEIDANLLLLQSKEPVEIKNKNKSKKVDPIDTSKKSEPKLTIEKSTKMSPTLDQSKPICDIKVKDKIEANSDQAQIESIPSNRFYIKQDSSSVISAESQVKQLKYVEIDNLCDIPKYNLQEIAEAEQKLIHVKEDTNIKPLVESETIDPKCTLLLLDNKLPNNQEQLEKRGKINDKGQFEPLVCEMPKYDILQIAEAEQNFSTALNNKTVSSEVVIDTKPVTFDISKVQKDILDNISVETPTTQVLPVKENVIVSDRAVLKQNVEPTKSNFESKKVIMEKQTENKLVVKTKAPESSDFKVPVFAVPKYNYQDISDAENNFYKTLSSVNKEDVNNKPGLILNATTLEITEEYPIEHCSDMVVPDPETPKRFVDDAELFFDKSLNTDVNKLSDDSITPKSKSWADIVATEKPKGIEDDLKDEIKPVKDEISKVEPIAQEIPSVKICIEIVPDLVPEPEPIVAVDDEGFMEFVPKKEIRKRKSRSRTQSQCETSEETAVRSRSRSRSQTKSEFSGSTSESNTRQRTKSRSRSRSPTRLDSKPIEYSPKSVIVKKEDTVLKSPGLKLVEDVNSKLEIPIKKNLKVETQGLSKHSRSRSHSRKRQPSENEIEVDNILRIWSREEILQQNVPIDGAFWPDKWKCHDAERSYFESVSSNDKQLKNQVTDIKFHGNGDDDGGPSSGPSSPGPKSPRGDDGTGNNFETETLKITADLPEGVGGWSDYSTYISNEDSSRADQPQIILKAAEDTTKQFNKLMKVRAYIAVFILF